MGKALWSPCRHVTAALEGTGHGHQAGRCPVMGLETGHQATANWGETPSWPSRRAVGVPEAWPRLRCSGCPGPQGQQPRGRMDPSQSPRGAGPAPAPRRGLCSLGAQTSFCRMSAPAWGGSPCVPGRPPAPAWHLLRIRDQRVGPEARRCWFTCCPDTRSG